MKKMKLLEVKEITHGKTTKRWARMWSEQFVTQIFNTRLHCLTQSQTVRVIVNSLNTLCWKYTSQNPVLCEVFWRGENTCTKFLSQVGVGKDWIGGAQRIF
jgi:hypothetical protein